MLSGFITLARVPYAYCMYGNYGLIFVTLLTKIHVVMTVVNNYADWLGKHGPTRIPTLVVNLVVHC